ncbi:MAG: hypothetical protein C4334_12935 [Pyrinomonas sp.]|uniref:lycopene cyclase family protein n=1 Tax=Pyrinomonas sp. TaxID=2080306 RepID=UPI0033291D9A
MKTADILILGAGCAGTLLAHYLGEEGFDGEIALCDARTSFDHEQRWCSWSDDRDDLSHLATRKWRSWLVGDAQKTVIKSSTRYVYREIYAPNFFEHFHTAWRHKRGGQIRLFRGERVIKVEPQKDGVYVSTDRRKWRARLVFDARHRASPQSQTAPTKAPFKQDFVGWVVRLPQPAFDPATVTLMDFQPSSADFLHFIYVLPYSANSALVESTCFALGEISREFHETSLTNYIRRKFGRDFEVVSEEAGLLPMHPIKPLQMKNVHAIGVAGGCARPSSGYAFHRIQRQARSIAEAIVRRKPIPQRVWPIKYGLFDELFLCTLARNFQEAARFFVQLFERTDADALIRFMRDESTLEDDLSVIAALPKRPFIRTLFDRLVDSLISIGDVAQESPTKAKV